MIHTPTITKTETPEPLCMESWVVGCSCGWNDPYFWAGEEGAVGVFAEHVLSYAALPKGYRVLVEVIRDVA